LPVSTKNDLNNCEKHEILYKDQTLMNGISAALRHMEKIRADMQDGKKVIVLW
jgi:hypothetical protein